MHSLAVSVKDQLIALDLPHDLNSLIAQDQDSIKIDKTLMDREKEHYHARIVPFLNQLRPTGNEARLCSASPPASYHNQEQRSSQPEPMQISQTQLSMEE